MTKPTIPMSPEQLPQQRVVALADLPERPRPFESVIGYDLRPPGVRYDKPRKPAYLGQVEWAWSSTHTRVDAYYLHRGRRYWMLWLALYDDNWEEWNWSVVGYVPCVQATRTGAAVYLLTDFWEFGKKENRLDHFHWINEQGELRASHLRTLGIRVWPEAASRAP